MTYTYPSTLTYGYPQAYWNSIWKRDAEAEADPQYMINTYGNNWANTWNTYRMPMTYAYPSTFTYGYPNSFWKRDTEAQPEADPQYMIKTYGINWANTWNSYRMPMTYTYPRTYTGMSYTYPGNQWFYSY